MKSTLPYCKSSFEKAFFFTTGEQIEIMKSQFVRDNGKMLSLLLSPIGVNYRKLEKTVKNRIGFLPSESKIPRCDSNGRYKISGLCYFLGQEQQSVKLDLVDYQKSIPVFNMKGQNFGKTDLFFPEMLDSENQEVFLTIEPRTALKYISEGKRATALLYSQNIAKLDAVFCQIRSQQKALPKIVLSKEILKNEDFDLCELKTCLFFQTIEFEEEEKKHL